MYQFQSRMVLSRWQDQVWVDEEGEEVVVINKSYKKLTRQMVEADLKQAASNRLIHLDLTHAQLRDTELKGIADFIGSTQVLKSLELRGNHFSTTGVRYLTLVLGRRQRNDIHHRFPSIKYLGLSRNRIGPTGAYRFGKMLQCDPSTGEHNTVLSHLDLSHIMMTHFSAVDYTGLRMIAHALGPSKLCYEETNQGENVDRRLCYNTTVEWLNLTGNRLTPDALNLLASSLRYNSTLKELSVAENQTVFRLETYGNNLFANSLLHHHRWNNLQTLDLSVCGLGRSEAATTAFTSLEKGIRSHNGLRQQAMELVDLASNPLTKPLEMQQRLSLLHIIQLSRDTDDCYLYESPYQGTAVVGTLQPHDCFEIVVEHLDEWFCVLLPSYGFAWLNGSGLVYEKVMDWNLVEKQNLFHVQLDGGKEPESRHNTGLQHLYLDFNHIVSDQYRNESLRTFLMALGHSLKTLSLKGNRLNDQETLENLVTNGIARCPSLEGVDLESNNIMCVDPFYNAILLNSAGFQNSSLERLNLRHNMIGATGCRKLANALKMSSSPVDPRNRTTRFLRYLNLERNHIGQVGALQLREMLRLNKTLLSLSITLNEMDDPDEVGLEPFRGELLQLGALETEKQYTFLLSLQRSLEKFHLPNDISREILGYLAIPFRRDVVLIESEPSTALALIE